MGERDDPQHPNLDGIRFQATTDKKGVIAVPLHADNMPPVSYLPLAAAVEVASGITDLIIGVRAYDAKSYLAHFLDDMLDDLTDAISACKPEPTDG